ncbi:MAG: AMP-binding protein, partial [Myxococcota bacterium]
TPFGPGDRWVASLKMHHVGGLALLFRALHGGGTVVFPEGRPLASLEPTHLSWVPTQLLRAASEPPPTLRHLLLGGAAAPPALVRERRALGWPVKTTYGSTETASQVCTSTTDADPHESGAPLAGRQLEATPTLRVRGTTVALGVWSDAGIEPLTDADGWLSTGDVGELTAQGTLRVHGRADTMFISGGENVFPEAIERVLGAHPDVRAVVVVDVPDPEWGARPWAFVDGDVDLDGLRAFSSQRLPRHAWVDRVLPWSAEGVTATGKPRRVWFRARAHALRSRR